MPACDVAAADLRDDASWRRGRISTIGRYRRRSRDLGRLDEHARPATLAGRQARSPGIASDRRCSLGNRHVAGLGTKRANCALVTSWVSIQKPSTVDLAHRRLLDRKSSDPILKRPPGIKTMPVAGNRRPIVGTARQPFGGAGRRDRGATSVPATTATPQPADGRKDRSRNKTAKESGHDDVVQFAQ